jgi:hypothetical protein
METAYQHNPYYAQSNDPRDVYREHFNISQERQQDRLGAGQSHSGVYGMYKRVKDMLKEANSLPLEEKRRVIALAEARINRLLEVNTLTQEQYNKLMNLIRQLENSIQLEKPVVRSNQYDDEPPPPPPAISIGEGYYGGSWSQPVWMGWKPIIGAGRDSVFQRYAQDGDAGFFYSRSFGRGMPIGMNPVPLNHLETEENYEQYHTPETSTVQPVIVEPSPMPIESNIEMELQFNAEPQQKADHVPPYSQNINQGMGKAVKNEENILYEEPFEYKGKFDKKRRK